MALVTTFCGCVDIYSGIFFKLFFECSVFLYKFSLSLSFTQSAGLGWMTRSSWAHSSAFLGWIWKGRLDWVPESGAARELAWGPGVCQAPGGQGQWDQVNQREVSRGVS